ncbi:MAG: Trk system potassium transporter TrkA [Bacteroidia bacterium]|nr:Trk system potassium transporter TrkA [Bacteroidia bacterium]
MKIVISGAGDIGFHLAGLLSKENQDITLIDTNAAVLNQAGRHLDVLTIEGDATTLKILEQANIKKAKLFIAVATSEKTNLLAAILAKKLGASYTIARISTPEYLSDENRERFSQLGVDVLISPQKLAAQEIQRLLRRASFTDLFEFENGKISVVGFTLDTACPLINRSIAEIDELTEDFKFRGLALLRGEETIIPHNQTFLRKGDHLYISTNEESLETAMKFAGKQLEPIKKVMIIGGTALALRTAQQIEKDYKVTIVMKDEERAKQFVKELSKSLVIHADPGDIDALQEEGLTDMDAFIALTPNSETNIISSLTAEQLGVYKTIALVENVNYTHISQNIGIDTIINKKLIAANNIFRFVRKGKVEAIAGLHGVDAEIIEFEIHKSNRLLKYPISELHFPEKSIIAGIVRGDDSFAPNDDFKFEIHDKVIVLALPEAIHQVEKIFR